jgi:SAM-dependent methyltransferase
MTTVHSASTMSEAMPHAHNYHRWVFDSFARYLKPTTALEIGSGHGAYSRLLAEILDSVIVSDIDPEAVERIRIELAGIPNVEYRVMDGVDPQLLGRPVDNIVLVNLLEHIEDDGALLAHCRDSLREDGRLVVFSPAFPLLFSRMDEEAGHFRRYTRGGIVDVVRGAGFEVTEVRFFNAIGFFGWYANKLVGSGIHGAGTNSQINLYNRLIPWTKRADALMPFIGQSLLVVGKKLG